MISLYTDHLFLPIKWLFDFTQESSFELSLHVHPVLFFAFSGCIFRCHRIAELEEIPGFIHPIEPNLSLKHPWAVVSHPQLKMLSGREVTKAELFHNFDCINHRKLFSVIVQNLPCWCKLNISRLLVYGLTFGESCFAFTPWRWLIGHPIADIGLLGHSYCSSGKDQRLLWNISP